MSRPVPDKAEVALDYPDKLYIGTFERAARFDAHLDKAGISLSLQRSGPDRKTVRIHLHYGLFAQILDELARTANAIPKDDTSHRELLAEAATALTKALQVPN
jgi:hypothetical protein